MAGDLYVVQYLSAYLAEQGRTSAYDWHTLSTHYDKASAQRAAQDRRDYNRKVDHKGERIRVVKVSSKNRDANRRLQEQHERYGGYR